MEMLRKHKEQQDKIIARLGDSYNNKGFIFTNVQRYHGYPILTKLVENRMTRLLKKVHFNPKLSPHSLRHTHTSLLAEAKVDIEDIKDRLGHFDDDVTRKIYLHVTDPVKREASDKFDNLMGSL
jgi:integrase